MTTAHGWNNLYLVLFKIYILFCWHIDNDNKHFHTHSIHMVPTNMDMHGIIPDKYISTQSTVIATSLQVWYEQQHWSQSNALWVHVWLPDGANKWTLHMRANNMNDNIGFKVLYFIALVAWRYYNMDGWMDGWMDGCNRTYHRFIWFVRCSLWLLNWHLVSDT